MPLWRWADRTRRPAAAPVIGATATALLAACSPTASDRTPAAPASPTAGAGATNQVSQDDTVACATGGGPLAARCAVEEASTPRGKVLTLRQPGGGFRRLLIARDGRGVVAADGAQPARVTIVSPGEIEVTVGAEGYRLPATIAR